MDTDWRERLRQGGVARFGIDVWNTVQRNIETWLEFDCSAHKPELLKLLDDADLTELHSRFQCRVKFGTAGIRAKMEVGSCRMNDLTIIQTTQGLAKCILEKTKDSNHKHSIVIGYDGRHNSLRFASLAANVCVKMGLVTYLFDEVCATPVVAYSVRKLPTDAGLVITASHNPKQDNGYKVYWSNGAQILDDVAECICKNMESNPKPLENVWDISSIRSSVKDPRKLQTDIISQYFKENVEKYCCHREINESCQLKFTYTALHGVGQTFTPVLMELFGFKKENIISVKEQAQPDADFMTLGNAFPNPEEGRSVLDLSIATANRTKCDVILANDPDADRLEVCERNGDTGEWIVFTGNEIGALVAWWCWQCWRKSNPDADPGDVWMINSNVSSRVVAAIAAKEGFNYEETATGFKNMANRASVLRNLGKTVLLAWEESIGYMPGESLDKDGVLAAAMMAECAAFLRHTHGRTLRQQLMAVFHEYGVHLTHNSYFMCNDPAVKQAIFDQIRFGRVRAASEKEEPVRKYPDTVGKFKVVKVEDRSAMMISFTLDNGCLATVRASGTEPKLKYYLELITPSGLDVASTLSKTYLKEAEWLLNVTGEIDRLKNELFLVEDAVIETLIQAKKYNLEKKKD